MALFAKPEPVILKEGSSARAHLAELVERGTESCSNCRQMEQDSVLRSTSVSNHAPTGGKLH